MKLTIAQIRELVREEFIDLKETHSEQVDTKKIWMTYGELKTLVHEMTQPEVDCAICRMMGKKHPDMDGSEDLDERMKHPYWGADKTKEKGKDGHPFWGKTKDKEEIDEIDEAKKKAKDNPWAICTSKVGRDDKAKYERCVQHVKKSLGKK